MGYSLPLDPIAGAVLTASGSGTPSYGAGLLIGGNRNITLELDVREVITPGALDVTVETAPSAGVARWRRAGVFPQVSAAGVSTVSLTGTDSWVRVTWNASNGGEFAAAVRAFAQFVVRPSGTVTTSGASLPVPLGQYRALRLALEVTAGTGALDVTVETAETLAAPVWSAVGSFEPITGPGEKLRTVGDLGRYVRLSWTLAGGPMTFSVAGTAHLVYANPADRTRFGVRGAAMPNTSDPEQTLDALILTAPTLDMYLQRWQHPLRQWDDALREAHVVLTDMELLRSRGAEPGEPGSTLYIDRYREWVGEPPGRLGKLDLIAKGSLTPHLVDSSEPDVATGKVARSVTASRPSRGWEESPYGPYYFDARRGW